MSRRLVVLGVLVLPLAGCVGGEDEHPPRASQCEGTCAPTIVTVGSGTGSDGAAGAPAAEITLSGDLSMFLDDTFDPGNQALFSGGATVTALGADGDVIDAEYDGVSFSLSGIVAVEDTKVLAAPTVGGALPLPTLHTVDTRRSRQVTLSLVSSDALFRVFNSISSPALLDSDRAQLVLEFVDSSSDPVAGVRLGVAQAEFVAYAAGFDWADDGLGTDENGLVVAGNIPAASFPGTVVTVELTGSVALRRQITLVRGAVTYARLSVD